MDRNERRYRAAIIGHTGHGNYGLGLETCFTGLPRVEVDVVADRQAGRLLDRERPDLVAVGPRLVDQRVAMIESAGAPAAGRLALLLASREHPYAAALSR